MFFMFALKEHGRNNEVVVRRGSTVVAKVFETMYRIIKERKDI